MIERSSGTWHTKCYDKLTAPPPEELVTICNTLGYKNATVQTVDGRAIDPTARQTQNRYRHVPTKAKVVNRFSTLRVNDNFEIASFKPSRPLNKIMRWDDSDKDKCFQLEINCVKNSKK